MPPQPKRRITLNVIFSILQKAQGAIFSYVTLRLLLKAMSVEDYGFYTVLFIAILQNLSQFLQFGIPSLLMRFVPELYTQGKFKTINRVFRTVNWLQIAFWGFLILIIFLFAKPLVSLCHFPGTPTDLRIFSVGAFAYLIQENFRTILGGIFRQSIIFWVILAYNAARLAAIFIVTQYAFSLLNVIVAEVATLVFGLVVYWITYHRVIAPLMETDQTREPIPWRRYIRYTVLCYVNELGVVVVGGLDLLFISGLLGAAAAGLYGLANRVIFMVDKVLPQSILTSLIQPLFFSEYGAAERSSIETGFSMLTKFIAFVTFPATVWIAVMSRPIIIYLFEAKFADAAPILAVLSMYLFVLNFKLPIGLVLQTAERIDLLIYVKIVGVLKIFTIFWLVPQGNIMTMAYIVLGASLIETLSMFCLMYTSTKITGDLKGMLMLVVNISLSVLVFLPLIALFSDGVTGVILSVPVFCVIFLLISYLNKIFTQKERDWLNSRLKKPVWVF